MISDIFRKISLNNNDIDFLLSCYEKTRNTSFSKLEELAKKEYRENINFDYISYLNKIKDIANELDINVFILNSLFVASLFIELENHYKKNNVALDVYFDTIKDLKYKIEECKLVKGITGTFVPVWYIDILRMKTFALGRLQYQIYVSEAECFIDGVNLHKGEKALSIHIPRTGNPFSNESVSESINLAKEFFKDSFGNDYIPFFCHSWLLQPQNKELLSEESNIRKFMDRFTLISSGFDTDYKEIWRLFDKEYDGDLSNLPSNTSLRRNYIELLKKNGHFGWGYGAFIVKK